MPDHELNKHERTRRDYEDEIKRCHGGACHYDINSYENGNIDCRNCGETAWLCCPCDRRTQRADCAGCCHYEIVGGGYLDDAPSHTLRCVHCGSTAQID
jgi:hypothetical protein